MVIGNQAVGMAADTLLAMFTHMPPVAPPTLVMPEAITTTTSETMRPYSTAVAPLASCRSFLQRLIMVRTHPAQSSFRANALR